MSGEDIEGVLRDHVGSELGSHPGPFVVKCRCGDDGTTHRYPGDAWDAHRAHVAAVLREQIGAAQAQAWDEALVEASERGFLVAGYLAMVQHNPYRAAPVAPSRGSGGES